MSPDFCERSMTTTTAGLFEPISFKLWKQDPKAFSDRLGLSFRETGFAVINDHSIDQAGDRPRRRRGQEVLRPAG